MRAVITRKIPFFIALVLSTVLMAALANAAAVDVYVDTAAGCDVGNAGTTGDPYCSLSEMQTAQLAIRADLVTATDTLTVHCKGTIHAAFDMSNSWVTNATYNITIKTDTVGTWANRHSGVFSTSTFYIDCGNGTTSTSCLDINPEFVIIDGLQFRRDTRDSWSDLDAVVVRSTVSSGGTTVIRNSIFKGNVTASANRVSAISDFSSGASLDIYNNIFYDFDATTSAAAIAVNSIENVDLSFNTFINNDTDINAANTSPILKNNIFQDSGTLISGSTPSASSANNLSDKASGLPGSNNVHSSTLTFTNKAGDDFSLDSSDTDAIGAGLAVAGITTDILEVTRDDPPSIGAFEYVAGSSGNNLFLHAIGENQ